MYYVSNSAENAKAVKEAFEKPCEEPDIIPLPKGYACKAVHPDTGELVEYAKLKESSRGKQWQNACSNEIGRLAQGNGRVQGTNTLFFIRREEIPKGRKAVYMRLVVADRPGKSEPERVRFTAGGGSNRVPSRCKHQN